MIDWLAFVDEAIRESDPRVLVTIAQARGSAPRETGAKLLVSTTGIVGSIGGGNLEYRAIDTARHLLEDPERGVPRVERVALGPSLGQCCGGNVTLVYERMGAADRTWISDARQVLDENSNAVLVTVLNPTSSSKFVVRDGETLSGLDEEPKISRAIREALRSHNPANLVKTRQLAPILVECIADLRPELWIFGSGHVGRALVQVVGGLAFRVFLVDSRVAEFPTSLPGNVHARVSASPLDQVATASAQAFFLVMTHSHPLDLAICEAVLRRGDFRYLGLIGSATKKARFLRQLRDGGIPKAVTERLVCPIGLDGIGGKKPGEIAVAVAAQLMQVSNSEALNPTEP